MSLPSAQEVRRRIETVQEPAMRFCLETIYLCCARECEIVGKPRTNEKAYGDKLTARVDSYAEQPVLILTVGTAKREGLERLIALPLETRFEPWTRGLHDYFMERKGETAFPFTRDKIYRYITDLELFQGLKYQVDKYTIKHDKVIVRQANRHFRVFKLHALRHLRASELMGHYGFSVSELATYGGWTYHTMARTSAVMDRYLSMDWQSYIPKLLKS